MALTFFFIGFSVGAKAGSEPIVIVNGYFFHDLHTALKDLKGGYAMYMISTPGGTKAVGIHVDGDIPVNMVKSAVPVEKVTEGDELLRRYHEAVAKGKLRATAKNQPDIKAGDEFPQFSATDTQGRVWTNADVKGKVMVLNLWFTGCGPCRAEMPELSAWKNEMSDVMFFSSTYESAQVAKPVLEKQKFNWTALVDDKQFVKYVGNAGYPLTIVVGKNGKVRYVGHGTSAQKRKALHQAILDAR